MRVYIEPDTSPPMRVFKDPVIAGAPPREVPGDNTKYNQYHTDPYVKKHAKKIIRDLSIYFDLLVGKSANIWKLNRTGHRCETCTDPISGAIILTNCPECGGIGYVPPYNLLGTFNVLLQYNSKQTIAGQTGNMEIASDNIVVIGAPILDDRDLFQMCDTGDIYLIDTMQPDVVALMGEVVTQVANVSRIPRGDSYYDVLDNLNEQRKPTE